MQNPAPKPGQSEGTGCQIQEPKIIVLSITNRCNLACLQCRTAGEVATEFSLEEIGGILNQIQNDTGCRKIIISGGEPLLHPDIYDIITILIERGFQIDLLTNGVDLAQSTNTLQRIGLGNITVSLDGPDPETHDMIRGHGSFERAIIGIKSAIEQGIRTSVTCVVQHANFQRLCAFVPLLERLGTYQLELRRCVPVKGATSQPILPDKKAYYQMLCDFVQYWDLHRTFELIICDPVFHLFLKNLNLQHRDRLQCPRCAAFSTVTLVPGGLVVPVQEYEQLLGSITSQRLVDIVASPLVQTMLAAEPKVALPESCHDCLVVDQCFGGCRGAAFAHQNARDPADITTPPIDPFCPR